MKEKIYLLIRKNAQVISLCLSVIFSSCDRKNNESLSKDFSITWKFSALFYVSDVQKNILPGQGIPKMNFIVEYHNPTDSIYHFPYAGKFFIATEKDTLILDGNCIGNVAYRTEKPIIDYCHLNFVNLEDEKILEIIEKGKMYYYYPNLTSDEILINHFRGNSKRIGSQFVKIVRFIEIEKAKDYKFYNDGTWSEVDSEKYESYIKK